MSILKTKKLLLTTGLLALALALFIEVIEHEDSELPFDKIINKYGFKLEEHNVTTEDGYILTLFRLPGMLNEM
jgi:hypothetical protein